MTEVWGSEMAAEGLSGREAVSSRMMGRDIGGTSEFPGVFGEAKSNSQSKGSINTGTSGGRSGNRSGVKEAGKSGKEASAESNSPNYASPMDAHHSQDLGRATIPMDSSTGLGQQPIATAGGFSTADIREGSLPNLSVGAASIPSFTLETQPRPAPTAVSPFSTTSTSSTSFNTSTFTGSSSKSTPSTSSTSHSTSPDITSSTGLSGRRTGPGAGGPFAEQQKPKRKTQAQMDEELRMRMEDMAGEGGAAGVEYEDGKPVAMKRGVKENMFRYI